MVKVVQSVCFFREANVIWLESPAGKSAKNLGSLHYGAVAPSKKF